MFEKIKEKFSKPNTKPNISHRGFVHDSDLKTLARVILQDMMNGGVLSKDTLHTDLKKYFESNNYVIVDSSEVEPEPDRDEYKESTNTNKSDPTDNALVEYINKIYE
jgi:hypothetical protein